MVSPGNKKKERVKTYLYRKPDGSPAFEVVRTERMGPDGREKDIRVRHTDASGKIVWKAPDVNVPYHLPELLAAGPEAVVFVVEGENKVEAMAEQSLLATCNRGGAGKGKFLPRWGPFFEKRNVVILPDNDKPGRDHADAVLKIVEGFAKKALILELPGLPPKGDCIDWFAQKGNHGAKLLSLAIAELDRAPAAAGQDDGKGDAWEGDAAQGDEEEVANTGWQPFPINLLPEPMANYVQAAAAALHCDEAMFALPMICSLGGLVGATRRVQLKPTWQEPSVFWGAIIADSSSLKTPALHLATGPVLDIQLQLLRQYNVELQQYEVQADEWRQHNHKSKHPASGQPAGRSPRPPVATRLIVSDITIEKLARLLNQNRCGLTVIRDELAGWFASFGQYKEGKGAGSDMAHWLQLFNGNPLIVDRQGGDTPTIVVNNACVSVCGSIQPAVCRRVFCNETFEAGLIARLLFCMPPRRQKVWTTAGIDEEVAEMYRRVIRKLFELRTAEDSSGDITPRKLFFNAAGILQWEAFYNDWGKVQEAAQGEHAYALAKLEAYAARFAALFCTVEHAAGIIKDEVISAEHVNRAAALVTWFSGEAERVYTILRTGSDKTETSKLVDFIKSCGGEITPRRLLRSNPSKYRDSATCQRCLDALKEQGLGRWERKVCSEKGGRPSNVFCLQT